MTFTPDDILERIISRDRGENTAQAAWYRDYIRQVYQQYAQAMHNAPPQSQQSDFILFDEMGPAVFGEYKTYEKSQKEIDDMSDQEFIKYISETLKRAVITMERDGVDDVYDLEKLSKAAEKRAKSK